MKNHPCEERWRLTCFKTDEDPPISREMKTHLSEERWRLTCLKREEDSPVWRSSRCRCNRWRTTRVKRWRPTCLKRNEDPSVWRQMKTHLLEDRWRPTCLKSEEDSPVWRGSRCSCGRWRPSCWRMSLQQAVGSKDGGRRSGTLWLLIRDNSPWAREKRDRNNISEGSSHTQTKTFVYKWACRLIMSERSLSQSCIINTVTIP